MFAPILQWEMVPRDKYQHAERDKCRRMIWISKCAIEIFRIVSFKKAWIIEGWVLVDRNQEETPSSARLHRRKCRRQRNRRSGGRGLAQLVESGIVDPFCITSNINSELLEMRRSLDT